MRGEVAKASVHQNTAFTFIKYMKGIHRDNTIAFQQQDVPKSSEEIT